MDARLRKADRADADDCCPQPRRQRARCMAADGHPEQLHVAFDPRLVRDHPAPVSAKLSLRCGPFASSCQKSSDGLQRLHTVRNSRRMFFRTGGSCSLRIVASRQSSRGRELQRSRIQSRIASQTSGARRTHFALWKSSTDFNQDPRTSIHKTRRLEKCARHSTVTLFARFLGLSTSVPRAQAV